MGKISSVSTTESATAGLGEKRECAGCGAKYYDLGKAEPACPRCGAVAEDEPETKKATGKSRKTKAKKKTAKKKSTKKAKAKPKKKAAKDAGDGDDSEEE